MQRRVSSTPSSAFTRSLIVLALLAACAAPPPPPILPFTPAPDSVFYVQNLGNDKRGLDQLIAAEIDLFGHKTRTGVRIRPPEGTDYLVLYQDRWKWDWRTYLYDFRIQVYDYATRTVVAESGSHQASLDASGRSHIDIVRRATRDLFQSGLTNPCRASIR